MFRHVTLFRWAEATTDGHVQEIQRALEQLPAAIPELRGYRTGPDLKKADGTWDFAVVADFDNAEDWVTYLDHPAHQKVRADLILPVLGERATVQYEC